MSAEQLPYNVHKDYFQAIEGGYPTDRGRYHMIKNEQHVLVVWLVPIVLICWAGYQLIDLYASRSAHPGRFPHAVRGVQLSDRAAIKIYE